MKARLAALARALGVPGAAAVLLLAGCAAFHYGWVVKTEGELRARQAAAQSARAGLAQRVSMRDPAGELRRFQALFPPEERANAEAARLHRLARASGLQLASGEYRLESRGALVAYRVLLPVRARYGELRAFVNRVLKEMPAASIDRLQFERGKPADAQLECQIQLTLYLRPSEGP